MGFRLHLKVGLMENWTFRIYEVLGLLLRSDFCYLEAAGNTDNHRAHSLG